MARSIFTDDYKRLVRLLVEARTSANLTQAQLGHRLGQPQSYVSKYENCERRVDVAEVLAIARAVNARASDLIRQIEEEHRQ